MFVLRRLLMAAALWGLLSGGAVFVCSSGDGDSLFNRPPVARDDTYQVPAGTTLVGAARATDPDGDRLVYRVVSGPTLGRLERFDGSTGDFRYISQVAGADSFEFRASDGRLDSNTGRVRIDVTASAGAAISGLAATSAGPVVLAGDRLVLLAPSGPTPLAEGVASMAPADGGWLVAMAGRTRCLDAWSGLGPGPACGPPRRPGLADPFAQGRRLRAVPGPAATRIEETVGGPPVPVASVPGPAQAAALHFDVSTPGQVWLAVFSGDGESRVLRSDDGGRSFRHVAGVPGQVVALAGLGAGRQGAYALRAPPDGPVLLDLEPAGGRTKR